MKNIAKMAVIGALMAIGIAVTRAETIEQSVKIQLKGVNESGDKVKVDNKELLKVLSVISDPPQDFTKGKLMLITDTAAETNGTTIVVRVKGKEDADVTSFFESNEESSDSVSDGKTDYSIRSYTFLGEEDGAIAGFTVSGYTTSKTKTLKKGDVSADATEEKSTVAGEGTLAGGFSILQGTVSVTGSKLIVE